MTPTGHGGAREGAGRKHRDLEDLASEDIGAFGRAKARHEASRADLLELNLRIAKREVLSRDAWQHTCSRALSTLAQTLRSLPDQLERKGLPAEQCVAVGEVLDEAMGELATQFEFGMLCEAT